MAPPPQDDSSAQDPSSTDQNANDSIGLAEAYRELARGEQAASALEANLTNLEGKLDAMLAAFEAIAQDAEEDVKDAEEQGQGDQEDNGKKDSQGTS